MLVWKTYSLYKISSPNFARIIIHDNGIISVEIVWIGHKNDAPEKGIIAFFKLTLFSSLIKIRFNYFLQLLSRTMSSEFRCLPLHCRWNSFQPSLEILKQEKIARPGAFHVIFPLLSMICDSMNRIFINDMSNMFLWWSFRS